MLQVILQFFLDLLTERKKEIERVDKIYNAVLGVLKAEKLYSLSLHEIREIVRSKNPRWAVTIVDVENALKKLQREKLVKTEKTLKYRIKQ